MPFLVYIVVILVALSSVLIELDWLTKPKLEPKAKAQQTASVALPAPPPSKVDGPNVVLSPLSAPKPNDAPPAQAAAPAPAETTASVQPAVTPATPAAAPPAVAAPPAAAQIAAPPAAPQTAAVALPVPPADTSASAKAAETKPVEAKAAETTGSGNAAETKVATAPAQPVQTEQPAAKPVATAVQPTTLRTTSNRCDVQACSSMYQSFRAADCTYQPMEGPRKICAAPSSGTSAQKAAPDPRQRSAESTARRIGDRPMNPRNKEADLREVERTVKRITAGEAAASAYEDDYDDRRPVIIYRRNPRW